MLLPWGQDTQGKEHMVAEQEALLTDKDVARRLAISVASVRRWRLLGQGPRHIKLGAAAVRYRSEDIASWLSTRPTGGEAR